MRDLRLRLQDMAEAIGKIEQAAVRGQDAFLQDEYLQVWMIHHIRNVGEAVRSVSDELRMLRPGVPWAQIVAMRHILVHHYFGVELDDVWKVVETDIPALRRTVEELLVELGDPDGAGAPDGEQST